MVSILNLLLTGQFLFGSSFGFVAYKGACATVLDLINCLMDPFDDVLPVAPAARARPGSKFIPKAKSKQLPRKEKSASASEIATSSKDIISGNEYQNAAASTLSVPAEESMGSIHHTQVELPNSKDATNSEPGNPKQVSVTGNSTALVDDSTIPASEVDADDQNSMNFFKSTCEADPVDIEVSPVTNFIPETNLHTGTTQPVHPANAVENELNIVAAPSTTCSTIYRRKELPKNGEGPFLDSNIDSKSNFGREQEGLPAEFELDPFSNILPDPGARNAHKFQPKIKPRPRVGNTPPIASASSNVMMEKSVELPTSSTNDFQSFQSSGDGSGGLNQSSSLPLPTSEIPRPTDLPSKFDYMRSGIPFSEDNKSLAAAIPSQMDSSLNGMLSEIAVHNGTRDWPSSFGKSSGEAADIFSGLESLDDFLTQPATDTGKPVLHSFNEKGAEENFAAPACSSINSFGECETTQVQRCPEYHTPQDSLTFNEAAVLNEDDIHTNNRRLETEEVVDPACPDDCVFDYQSMKSGEDPTSGIPVHEELTNAADSPTLADFLHADVTREKEDANERKKDGSMSCSLRKHRRSSSADEEDKGGKRQLRKQAAHKPANNSLNEDVEDDDDLDPPYNSNGDEFQENDDDYEVDYSSKKKRVSTSSKKKSVAKSGKTSQKRKKANDDLEKTKEPPKKFSHSTRRKRRCVDKALLEIPEDELDPQTLPMKDIILLAEHRERLAKKEAMTSSSTHQSVEDSFHEANANNEDEFFGSEDGRDPDDDQANEVIPSASTLFNYQTFMEKAPRGKWSKQDTELFYEAVRELGTDFSMIQQLFPDKTRHQIKLKYKKEERQHPLRLSDAINNHAKDRSHYKLLIERLQQASTKAEEDPSRDASEEVVDLTPGTNVCTFDLFSLSFDISLLLEKVAEVATTKQDADVKAQEDSGAVHSPEQSEDSDDDFKKWSQYKSFY
ncbi:bdp1, partial [Mucuna pruriens]